jgi:hypothetical protein
VWFCHRCLPLPACTVACHPQHCPAPLSTSIVCISLRPPLTCPDPWHRSSAVAGGACTLSLRFPRPMLCGDVYGPSFVCLEPALHRRQAAGAAWPSSCAILLPQPTNEPPRMLSQSLFPCKCFAPCLPCPCHHPPATCWPCHCERLLTHTPPYPAFSINPRLTAPKAAFYDDRLALLGDVLTALKSSLPVLAPLSGFSAHFLQAAAAVHHSPPCDCLLGALWPAWRCS